VWASGIDDGAPEFVVELVEFFSGDRDDLGAFGGLLDLLSELSAS
jgi:hypothetical protein